MNINFYERVSQNLYQIGVPNSWLWYVHKRILWIYGETINASRIFSKRSIWNKEGTQGNPNLTLGYKRIQGIFWS